MFARKIRVEYKQNGAAVPCPLKWLDSFSMRSFTNFSVFDETLPVADGEMEIGSRVPLDQLRESMERELEQPLAGETEDDKDEMAQRQANAAMVLATQTINDFASADVLRTVVESCPTKYSIGWND